ncbi:diguanylate cyclase [Candidatus Oleimmundimicrobium sp.]|uniref:GGDEF domain-containing protein n=1 Tax=Candidatus Oleimmundimicrobium sp. TaxID=3060597 RepID=UPI0027209574|nr:diguanylate cyclase [Candidatus Oleimmundimicrobium sp.]MDO8885878.1 diguanylate cyclase [Candidatus Oleimmundimicrobium sp.]
MKTGEHLASVLAILVSFAFVSIFIGFTGQLNLYWYLYIIPIFIAAITYNLIGSLMVGIASIGILVFWFYSGVGTGLVENPTVLGYEMITGTSIFLIAGLILGYISGKQKKQQAQLERLSVRDRLTGLYNYSYFVDRLDEEIKRSNRYETPLGLIMLDIDYFKDFNDTFGHEKGNKVLKDIAEIIKEKVRDIDIVARYGGEEFAVLLPSVGKEAKEAAERIRKAVEMAEFEGDVEQPIVKKTISAGVAVYPRNAKDDTGLVVKADEALYKAKESGRNQTCVCEQSS